MPTHAVLSAWHCSTKIPALNPSSRPSSTRFGKNRLTLPWESSKNGRGSAFGCNCSWTMRGHTIRTAWKTWRGPSRAMASTTQSTWCFARLTKGRYGAVIERLFQNFSGQVKELAAGAIQSSDPKDVRAAAESACLLYPDMNRFLHQLILRYHHTPHRELQNRTPHEVWRQGIQSSGLPLVPPFTPPIDRLFCRMYPQTINVRSIAIPALRLHYCSSQLR